MEDLQQSTDYEQYAGFWVRFFSACIDMLLYTPIYFGMKYFLKDYPIAMEVAFAVIGLGTYAWFFSSTLQGSPGMYILKFHICDIHGKRISFGRALYWGVSSTFGWLLCCAGILYLEKDINNVSDMMQSCKENNVDISECVPEIEKIIGIPFPSFEHIMWATTGLTFFLLLIWALSIALPRDKTGFHNVLCGTRFVKGRAV